MLEFDVKYVAGYEGRYIAYKDGHIYSIPRRGTKGGFLKESFDSGGYFKVRLTNPDGSQRTWRVHTLILTTFVGPRPEGMEACHNNGDKTDNRLENLRWDTSSANNLDKRKHGTSGGERNGRAKLTAEQTDEIRSRYSTGGCSYSDLAQRYGVDKTTIGRVVCGTSWTQR